MQQPAPKSPRGAQLCCPQAAAGTEELGGFTPRLGAVERGRAASCSCNGEKKG